MPVLADTLRLPFGLLFLGLVGGDLRFEFLRALGGLLGLAHLGFLELFQLVGGGLVGLGLLFPVARVAERFLVFGFPVDLLAVAVRFGRRGGVGGVRTAFGGRGDVSDMGVLEVEEHGCSPCVRALSGH